MNTKKTFKISKKYLTIGIGTVALLIGLAIVGSVLASNGVGFEIDGNMFPDYPPADDWESVILGPGPDYNQGPGLLIRDGSSGPKAIYDELDIFAKGGKFGVPEEWTIEPGNTPAQNDLTKL